MHRIIASIYPNNELRVRIAPSPRPRDIFAEEETPTAIVDGGLSLDDADASLLPSIALQPPDPNLDISFDLKTLPSPKLSPGFGSKGKPTKFGLKGRRTIVRCGGAIDRDHVPNESLFLTGTLPGSTQAAIDEICKWSSYLVNGLKAWIAKRTKAVFSMYTCELQKRGALHLHYVAVIPDQETRDRIRLGFKKQWYRLLENITEKTGIDMFARPDGTTWRGREDKLQAYAVECKKSVAAYISKYISKGTSTAHSENYPVRWWGCSRPLLARLDELTETIEIDKLSRGRAESIYQDIKYDLQPLATSSYDYRDRVGQGENQVHYLYPNYVEEAWKNVLSRQPITMRKTTVNNADQFASSQSIFRLLRDDYRLYGQILRNCSGIGKNAVMRYLASQQLTAMELACTIAELYSLLSLEQQAGRPLNVEVSRWMEVYRLNRSRSQGSKKKSQGGSTEVAIDSPPSMTSGTNSPTYEQLRLL